MMRIFDEYITSFYLFVVAQVNEAHMLQRGRFPFQAHTLAPNPAIRPS